MTDPESNSGENHEKPRRPEPSQSHLEAVVETAHDGIATIDRDGIVHTFNEAAEEMFGYERGEVVGENISMLMPSPHRDRHDGYIERYLKTGEAHIIGLGREVEAVKKDGTRFPIHLEVSEFESDGSVFFAGFMRDLTDQKRLEEEVRQVQKMEAIGTLTTGVAHDFNNVLMGISGHAQMALAKLDPEHPAYRHVESAKHAVARGAGLTNRLLTFTRRENGEGHPVVLDEVVSDVEPLLRPLVTDDVDLELHLDAGETSIECEPSHLDQILLNLVVNARDASGPGDRIDVATEVVELDDFHSPNIGQLYPGRYLVLSVRDEGEGMDEQTLQQIFDPFFTTKPVGKGTGLGLSTIYGIVQQWDGAIEVETTPGEGTEFRVYFEALADRPDREGRVTAPREKRPVAGGDGERVLVLDDDDQERAAIVAYLANAGYEPMDVGSAEDAVAVARQTEGFDAAIVDLVLGSEHGETVARELLSAQPDLPLIFTSGHADLVGHDELLETETDVLEKPFSKGTLLAAMERALEAGERDTRAAFESTRSPRILVVEDDELARNATCELLAQEGYEALDAGSGEGALEVVRDGRNEVDVAVVDLTLPDRRGTELVDELREAHDDRVPVVFVSGVDPEQPDVARSLEHPSTTFLQKPIDIDRLVASIESVRSNA